MNTEPERIMIDLSTPLSMRSSFRFPLQSVTSRREMIWGAVLLVVLPGIGWFLNMGHRVVVVTGCSTICRPGRLGTTTESFFDTA